MTKGKGGRWRWLTAMIAATLIAAAILLWFRYRDTTTPVAVDQAAEQFAESATVEPDADPIAPGPTLAGLVDEGVYVYATTGGEEVDALGGTRHDYPPETTITVRTGGCGFVLTWQPLQERHEDLELCRGDDGLVIHGYTSFHRFFGTDDRLDYRCDPPIVLGATASDVESPTTCVADDLTEMVSTTPLGTERIAVGSDEVTATGIALDVALDGASTGTTRAELWVTERGLIVSWSEVVESVSGSPIGDVHYTEQFELQLTSIAPVK